MLTEQDFGVIMAMRLALWDQAKELDEASEAIWFEMLKPLDAGHVRAALVSFSREGHAFPPVVGQIFRKAFDLADTTPEWGVAWREMRDRCEGSLGEPETWSHVAVYEAARQIGLSEIGNSERGDPAFEAQCRGVYESVRNGEQEAQLRRGIPGISGGRLALEGGSGGAE